MSFFQFFLILHLLGAGYLGILTFASFFSLISKKVLYYKHLSKQVAVIGCFQLVTGSLLTLLIKKNGSVLTFCSKIGLYLGIVLLLEYLLYKALPKENRTYFPLSFVTGVLSFGIFISICSGFYL